MADPIRPKNPPRGLVAVSVAGRVGRYAYEASEGGDDYEVVFFVPARDDPACARVLARCAAGRGGGMMRTYCAKPGLIRVRVAASRLPDDFAEMLAAAAGEAVIYVEGDYRAARLRGEA